MKSLLARISVLGVLGAVWLVPCVGLAEPADPGQAAAAQKIYDQATAEMDQKSYASACKKLEEVVKLVPDALGAKMTLGECYEGLGKIASAWWQYTLVQGRARAQGQTERAERAAERIAALQPRLATLTVQVPADVAKTPGLVITRDNVALSTAEWGAAVPVDTGAHEVVVAAPGRKPWKKMVDVRTDGAAMSISVEAPATEVEAGDADAAGKTGNGDMVAPEGTSRPWQKSLGIGVTAAGGVGLIVGAITGLTSMANRDASNDQHCNAQNFCDPEGLGLRNDALAFGNVSTAAFIVGGVLAGAGVVLVVTAPKSGSGNAGPKVAGLRVLPGGAALVGEF